MWLSAWICLDITRFYEEQRQPSSGCSWPVCPQNGKSTPLLGVGGFDTICTAFCNSFTACRLCRLEPPGTIIKLILNYIKGRKAYTTYINHTSPQRQFNTGITEGGILSPTLFNIDTADIPQPRAPVQVMAYADGITITSTHTGTSATKKYIQPYLHNVFPWTKQNNLTISMKDRKTSEELRKLVGVQPITTVIRSGRLR